MCVVTESMTITRARIEVNIPRKRRGSCENHDKVSTNNRTKNKAKQHSTPKAVTFHEKNELPWVGLEPTTLHTLDRALYMDVYLLFV